MATDGSCNCGAIKVTISALPPQSLLCYCSNCRKSSSSAFSANYYIEKSSVKIRDSNSVLKSYADNNTKSSSTVTRQFCGTCGSNITTLPSGDAPKVILKAALFDHIPAPGLEVFDHEKPAWLQTTKLKDDESN